MQRTGPQRDFIVLRHHGKRYRTSIFSCYYPPWTRSILSSAPAPFKCVNMPTLLNEEMMYAPLGDMYFLQAVHGSATCFYRKDQDFTSSKAKKCTT